MNGGRWRPDASVLRFLLVGVTVTALDFAVLTLLHGVLQWDVVLSAVIAFLAAFVVNFTLNRRWTFDATDGVGSRQLLRFTILVAANTVVTAVGIGVLTRTGLHYLVAKVFLTGVIVVANYVIMRRWVFRSGS